MIQELRIGNYVQAPLGEIMQVDILGHKENPNYIHAISDEIEIGIDELLKILKNAKQ